MDIRIEKYTTEYEMLLLDFWNRVAVAQGYTAMKLTEFRAAITQHAYWRPEQAYLALAGDECKGFICGCYGSELPGGEERGYLTCMILDTDSLGLGSEECNRAGLMLVEAMETSMAARGVKEIVVNCFNPMRLSWHIEGECLHNNCPGVAMDLGIFEILKSKGYQTLHEECAMFLDLNLYREDETWIKDTLDRANREGYAVEWYRSGEHKDLKSMVDGLHNPMWSAEIPEAAERINMIVALKGDRVVGFTGPVYAEPSGRGYFAGIAVSADHERHGLGTLLFLRLLSEEQKCGSRYMSLFTGTDNNARRIYERAGFRVKRRFATMSRQLA